MSWTLLRSAAFVRAARKRLRRHPEEAGALFEAAAQLKENPFHSSLRTHKLTGVLAGSRACSAGYNLRIIFRLGKHAGKPAIILQSVGTHDEVY